MELLFSLYVINVPLLIIRAEQRLKSLSVNRPQRNLFPIFSYFGKLQYYEGVLISP